MRRAASGWIARLSPKGISSSPIADACIPTLWRMFLEQGADVIVRTPWKGARWYGKNGKPFDLLAALAAAETAGVLDRPIWVLPKKAAPLPLRLVALRKAQGGGGGVAGESAGRREMERPRHL